MKSPLVPISIGELLDKITILQIKSEHTDNDYIKKELQDLTQIAQDLGVYKDEYVNDLLKVNRKLWDVEDILREHEKNWVFDDEFVRYARSVYITNDKRSKIKKRINDETLSEYSEVKLY
jgi:hypothetical protein